METSIDCLPCFLKQSIIALNMAVDDAELKRDVLRKLMPVIEGTNFMKSPAFTTSFLHRTIRAELGLDPFSGVKEKYNGIALGFYDDLKKSVRSAPDPLALASRFAIAGNIIDFGVFSEVDLHATISRAVDGELHVDHYDQMKEMLKNTGDILYLLDNAGEIVFDRLLIEELLDHGKKVTAVVKGDPVLNDVTISDAEQAGLTSVCEVIDNGSDGVGTVLEWCSGSFVDAFDSVDLVISKGQGNYETLEDARERMLFLLQSKCSVLANHLGVPDGAMLLIAR